MPKYQYLCRPQDGGCGHVVEFECLMSELDDLKPKSCPKCKKRKALQPQIFSPMSVNVPKTLGSFADKQSAELSSAAKVELTEKFNEYKRKPGESSWISTTEGMKHK